MTARTRAAVEATDPDDESLQDLETDLSSREIDIIRSAYRVIARQGGHRVSLQDVADEAGVSKGLVLYHFRSKSNLLLSTMRWALLAVAERIRATIDDSDDPVELLDRLLEVLFIDAPRNRAYQLLYIDMIEHAARDESFVEVAEMTERIVDGIYAEIIQVGIDRGVFGVDDADEAASLMRAVIEGKFLTWLPREDWETHHAQLRPQVRVALHRLLEVAET